MVEYRRQLDLENSRARAGGGIFVNSAPENKKPIEEKEDPVASLKKLKELLEHDLISQEDFDKKKAEILSKL